MVTRKRKETDNIDGFEFKSSKTYTQESSEDEEVDCQSTDPSQEPSYLVGNPVSTVQEKIVKKIAKNARRPLPFNEFPDNLPADCRKSCVKFKAFLRLNPGMYTAIEIDTINVLIRRNSCKKAAKKYRHKHCPEPKNKIKTNWDSSPVSMVPMVDATTQTD